MAFNAEPVPASDTNTPIRSETASQVMTADSEGEEADTLNEMYSEEVIGASFSGSFVSSFPQAFMANAERSVIYNILIFIC